MQWLEIQRAVTAMAVEVALNVSLKVESQNRNIEMTVKDHHKYMVMTIEKGGTPIDEFEGPYEVVPKFYYDQVLETIGKLMVDNVNVNAIQIHEVSNQAGGKTVTIGSV